MRRDVSPRAIDVSLACLATAVTAAALAADIRGPEDRPISVVGALLAPAVGSLLLLRRRYPSAVLVVSALLVFAYYAAGFPPVGLELPLAAAFFSAAEGGKLRFAIGTGIAVTVFAYGYRILWDHQDLARTVAFDLIVSIVVIGGAIAGGDALRSRRRARADALRREELLAARQRQETLRRIETERGDIARDVHDVLAHTIALISVQADVAQETLRDDPDVAAAAVANVRAASSSAMKELRESLELLRTGGDTRHPTQGLGELERLAEQIRGSGVDVRVIETGSPRSLPTTVDCTAYRIVREALTNTLRHADADTATVTVTYQPAAIELDGVPVEGLQSGRASACRSRRRGR